MQFLETIVGFLAAAVIIVPLFTRLGLGSILGYLATGLVIATIANHLIEDPEVLLKFGEFGVVLLLFLIGLEMHPPRLWSLRRPIFGLGGLQIGVTAFLLTGAGVFLGLGLATAILVGLVLALSSTAVAVQLLSEKGQLRTRYGRTAFSMLLAQDLAVIPLLALIPMIALPDMGAESVMDPKGIMVAIAAIVGVIVAGHFLTGPFLAIVASTGVHEIFTASALLIAVGTATIMELVGLSMALGTFIAGVLLAESEFRHQLEADIEPFKGLLMGLFFIAVGMTVDIKLIIDRPGQVFGLAVGLMAIKFAVLVALGKLVRLRTGATLRLGIVLFQGGEFAFVLLTAALSANAIDQELAALLIAVVTVTMVATPIAFAGLEWFRTRFAGPTEQPEFDRIEATEGRVIIAGFGRVGQMVGRALATSGIPFTALDNSREQVRVVRRFGNKVFYGDPSRLPMLRAAGAAQAEVLVLAIDDAEASIATVELVRKHFPHLKVYARARDRNHAAQLMRLGIDRVVRETFAGSLEIATHALQGLGVAAQESHVIVDRFQEHDEAMLRDEVAPGQIAVPVPTTAQSEGETAMQLEGLFSRDEKIEADSDD